jgi:hypothetical protein
MMMATITLRVKTVKSEDTNIQKALEFKEKVGNEMV